MSVFQDPIPVFSSYYTLPEGSVCCKILAANEEVLLAYTGRYLLIGDLNERAMGGVIDASTNTSYPIYDAQYLVVDLSTSLTSQELETLFWETLNATLPQPLEDGARRAQPLEFAYGDASLFHDMLVVCAFADPDWPQRPMHISYTTSTEIEEGGVYVKEQEHFPQFQKNSQEVFALFDPIGWEYEYNGYSPSKAASYEMIGLWKSITIPAPSHHQRLEAMETWSSWQAQMPTLTPPF